MPRTEIGKVELVVDTGNTLLDRSVDGFLKIGTVALTRAAAEEVYFMAIKGSISSKGVEHSLKKMCKEGAYWGAVAGAYVGIEYGVAKIRDNYDYKNAMIAGAVTGAVVSAVSNSNRDKIVVDALTGGAIATAAQFLNYLV